MDIQTAVDIAQRLKPLVRTLDDFTKLANGAAALSNRNQELFRSVETLSADRERLVAEVASLSAQRDDLADLLSQMTSTKEQLRGELDAARGRLKEALVGERALLRDALLKEKQLCDEEFRLHCVKHAETTAQLNAEIVTLQNAKDTLAAALRTAGVR